MMFADRRFGIASTAFISNGTFLYDEAMGEIAANPDFDGVSRSLTSQSTNRWPPPRRRRNIGPA
jgi:hypothetical protein